jgi:hypothetical protein
MSQTGSTVFTSTNAFSLFYKEISNVLGEYRKLITDENKETNLKADDIEKIIKEGIDKAIKSDDFKSKKKITSDIINGSLSEASTLLSKNQTGINDIIYKSIEILSFKKDLFDTDTDSIKDSWDTFKPNKESIDTMMQTLRDSDSVIEESSIDLMLEILKIQNDRDMITEKQYKCLDKLSFEVAEKKNAEKIQQEKSKKTE